MSNTIYRKDIPESVYPLFEKGMKKLKIKAGSNISRAQFRDIVLEGFKIHFDMKEGTTNMKKTEQEIYESLFPADEVFTDRHGNEISLEDIIESAKANETVTDEKGNEHRVEDIVAACKAGTPTHAVNASYRGIRKLAS